MVVSAAKGWLARKVVSDMNTLDQAPPLESLKFTIRTRDFESSRKFYREILDLAEVEAWDEDSDRGLIVSPGGAALIEISEIRPHSSSFRGEFLGSMGGEKVDIQLRTSDVERWARRLSAAGWPFRGPVDRPWGARYIYLHDPDGVKIILYDDATSRR